MPPTRRLAGGADPDRGCGALTAARGRSFRFHNETLEEAYASRASYQAPDWQVEAWVTTYTAIAPGRWTWSPATTWSG